MTTATYYCFTLNWILFLFVLVASPQLPGKPHDIRSKTWFRGEIDLGDSPWGTLESPCTSSVDLEHFYFLAQIVKNAMALILVKNDLGRLFS